jgi:GNAT superfamily N-acetyltransferase
VEDAERIGEVHVRAWEAYRGLLPDEFLDSLDPVARGERWRQTLTERTSESTLLVAERDGVILGISAFGPERDGPDGELGMINVVPEAWGTGVAQPLFDRAIAGLRDAGHKEAVLWCLEGNARARRFYERNGWRTDGATKDDTFGGALAREVRYRISLL